MKLFFIKRKKPTARKVIRTLGTIYTSTPKEGGNVVLVIGSKLKGLQEIGEANENAY